MRFWILLSLTGLLFSIISAQASSEPARDTAISIQKAPVAVERKTFPAGQPPLHLRARSSEVAFCESAFTCVVEIRARTRRQAFKPPSSSIVAIQFRVGLEVTLWLPEDADRRIIEHEQAHQAISEHFYHQAETVGRGIARRLLAEAPDLSSPGSKMDERLSQLRDRLIADYMAETHQRSEFAQKRFDAITDHGRKRISNDVGITQALREEEDHFRRLSAGLP